MKKAFFVSLLTLWCAFIFAQPTITNLSLPNSVDVFGLFEMSFLLGTYDNPYDPDVVDVYAEFTSFPRWQNPQGQRVLLRRIYLPTEGRLRGSLGKSRQRLAGEVHAQSSGKMDF